jgi:hypothetical protein
LYQDFFVSFFGLHWNQVLAATAVGWAATSWL